MGKAGEKTVDCSSVLGEVIKFVFDPFVPLLCALRPAFFVDRDVAGGDKADVADESSPSNGKLFRILFIIDDTTSSIAK